MYTVSPRDVERFALRILLLNRKGATSFEDLRTTGPDGSKTVHPTFLEAAKALGLFDDDTYLRQSLEEAIHIRSPAAIRSFFATLMVYTEVSDAELLWTDFWRSMAEDFIHQGVREDQAKILAYYDVLDRVSALGKDLRIFIKPPLGDRPEIPDAPIDYDKHKRDGSDKYDTLNPRQKEAADAILNSNDQLFFIDGPGGTGKTYLYNCLYDILVGQRKKVVCVAWTGIAANLLPGGRTANSTFKLIMGDNNGFVFAFLFKLEYYYCSSSSMSRQDKDAKSLRNADLIIWDEISMVPRRAFEAVDALLRDLTQVDKPFGGIRIVVGGDFRQVFVLKKHN